MKYFVLIIDGAAGLPLPQHNGKTCLELARTPNLDAMVREGVIGLTRTVPAGMEPGSAIACMSVLGYDPGVYYRGRAAIEARSMYIDIGEDEAVFRCNLVAVKDDRMWSYSSGHISTPEAQELIFALNKKLGSNQVHFYPGVNYRHICKIKGHGETLQATCTPPHDIPGRAVVEYLPQGTGSILLRELMSASETVLREHPVNAERLSRGEIPATMIWLFWGCGRVPEMPEFKDIYGLKAAMTSGVDLLKGLARMVGIDVLEIKGITDGMDNDCAAQSAGALAALDKYDLTVVHVEAPDEAAHAGSIENKIKALEDIDRGIIGRLRAWKYDEIRLLAMPDHPTPIEIQTHTDEPVPFLLWGPGFASNGAKRLTEREAKGTGFFIDKAYNIMNKLIKGNLKV